MGFRRIWVGMMVLALACSGDDAGDDGVDSGPGTESGQETSAGSSGQSNTGQSTSTSGGSTTGVDTTAGDSSGGETTSGEQVDVWELRAGGFSPPTVETFYSCFSFQIEVDKLHHIIGFEPVVTNPVIHHYVLSLSDEPVELDPSDSCFEWPAKILWAWAPGIESQMLPPEAGFLVGDAPGGIVTLILQVHYNNPLQMPTEDNDGIDVLVTPDLRPNAAAIFSQGDIATIAIPPGDPSFPYTATCGSNLTNALLDHEIHVFSSFLHAHEIGAAITTEITRGGQPVGEITQDPFDFNSQKFQPTDIDIMPGDQIQTHCTYDSSDRDGWTMGGVASDEEMCINFLMYYPRVTGEKCGAL